MPTDALISQEISALMNGISQQPATQRSPSQAEEQINCTSDVAKGVKRRVPFEHVAPNAAQNDLFTILGASPDEYFIHIIDLGPSKQFAAFFEDNNVRIFNLADGNLVGRNEVGSSGFPYLDLTASGLAARDAFEAITIGDTTFITNKAIDTAVDGTIAAGTRSNEFLFHAKPPIGATINANTVTISFDTAVGTPLTAVTGNSGANTTSAAVVDNLLTALTGGTVSAQGTAGVGALDYSDWFFTRIGDNVIHGEQTVTTRNGDFDIVSSSDAHGDSIHIMAVTSVDSAAATVTADASVQAFSDLPERGKDGFVIKVSGDNAKNEDDFYVTFDETENVWKETVKTGLGNVSSFDPDTMPHILLFQQSDSTFDFGPASASGPFPDGGTAGEFAWASRAVGDVESAPLASFVGFPIKDITIHKNRMLFIADTNVISTETGNFFNFWPTTVTELLDSDPFDIASTGNRVSILDYAVPFKSGVTLFSSIGDTIDELVGSRDEQLTLKNARVEDRATLANSAVRPASTSDSIFFVLDRGDRSGVYQYKQLDIGDFGSVEITSHVPNFVPQDVYRIAPGRAENMIAFLTSDTLLRNEMYIYRFWEEGKDLVMSSWSKFVIDDDAKIVDCGWIDSVLYVFIHRQDGMHIEKLDFGKSEEHVNFPHRAHLDSQLKLTGVYASGPDETTWTLPYDQVTNGGTFAVYTGEGFGTNGDERGQNITIKSQADLSIVAEGDWSDDDCYIGRVYESSYELSQIVLRAGSSSSAAGQTSARISGRLQLKRARVVYENTGTFDVEVTSRDADDDDTYTYTFTSDFINQAVFGPRTLSDGIFEFDIAGNANDVVITFKSSEILPFILGSAEWEGRFFQRSTQG